MTRSFISLVAEDILKATPGELKDLAVIFPNLRSGTIFRQELINQLKVPSWSPGIFSIDDWLIMLSGLTKADKLIALVLLFQTVKEEIPEIQVFSDFIDLGEILLSDFDDTDKYLVEPFNLFTALNEIKKIDHQFDITSDPELVDRIRVFWSSFGAGRSAHQEKWLQIWDKMFPIYQKFSKRLIDNGLGTSGMCYRKAAEDLNSKRITLGRFTKVVFVGFNILTAAEEAIFNYLKDSDIAVFYWDYHPFYLQSPHEAGKFIQSYLNKFPAPPDFKPFADGDGDFFQSATYGDKVRIVPVTSNTSQVQALLNDIGARPEASRGIILSDEGLFSDLLSSWPEGLPVNFTAGYPLRDTQAAGFFLSMINIYQDFQESLRKTSCRSGLIIDFLRHPWTKWLTGDSNEPLIQLIKRRFPESVPKEFVDGESRLSPWIGMLSLAGDFLVRLNDTGTRLMMLESPYSSIEKAAIDMIVGQSLELQGVANTYQLAFDARSISRLFGQFIHSGKISLETDRNACNQVTGILETRLVDFEEVFVLSFNEGVWPSKSLAGSLIPYSMRRIFNLPTAENRDAMYAYYWYRLIQRSKTVYIYYLTGHRDDSIRSGERSRYITQLIYELPKKIEIRPEPPARVGDLPNPIIIKKEKDILVRLNRYLLDFQGSKSLSPSAINEYLDCGLRFALKRIYDFREPDEIAFAAEPKGFGTLIHQVMNRLYHEYIGKEQGPGERWLAGLIQDQGLLAEIILLEYNLLLKEKGTVKPGGKELLAMEVVRQYLNKILEFDKQKLPGRILGLEQAFRLEYPFEINGTKCRVNLNGIIDRIDQVPEGIRIIDYKTGNIDLGARTIGEMFNRKAAKRPKEVFQVLLYCEYYLRQTSAAAELIPCLFRLGRFRAGDLEYQVQIADNDVFYSQIRNDFLNGFNEVIQEIFNPDIPFEQCEDVQTCRYCPFTGICSRDNYS